MRKEKQLLLDEINGLMDKSQSMVITRYQNMDPNRFFDFRMKMAKAGGEFEVIKKRVFIKALVKAGLPIQNKDLHGHVGILFGFEDSINSTKALFQFEKEHEGTFEVLCGRFEGKFCSAKDVTLISQLPSLDEMRAQFLATLEAPMSQTLSVIDALLTSVMHCLDNKSSKE